MSDDYDKYPEGIDSVASVDNLQRRLYEEP